MSASEQLPPVACSLADDRRRDQAARWRQLATAGQAERVEIADGLRIRFRAADGVTPELKALVAIERDCCRWAKWDVLDEDDSLVLVATSTSEGVKALHGMFLDVPSPAAARGGASTGAEE